MAETFKRKPLEIIGHLDDGTPVAIVRPSQFVRALPSDAQWTKLVGSIRKQIPGLIRRHARVDIDANETRFDCICCGLPSQFVQMSEIRIGALVRIPKEEMENGVLVFKKAPSPRSTLGLGCPTCAGLYWEQLKATNRANRERAKEGKTELTAWLDVGEKVKAIILPPMEAE